MSTYSYDPREQQAVVAIRATETSRPPPLSYNDQDAWTDVAINGAGQRDPADYSMVQDVLETSPGELDAAVASQNDNFPTDANGELQFDDAVGGTDYPTDAKGSLQFDDGIGGTDPDEVEITDPQTERLRGTEALFKVRLVSAINAGQMVIFEVSPTSLSESNTTTYNTLDPVHMPGNYRVFKNAQSRTFTLSAKLVSRNTSEAMTNGIYLQRLRAWMKPYFGEGTRKDTPKMLGAPPEVLYLYGYTNQQQGTARKQITFNYHRIPVVIESMSVSYPDGVDYVPAANGEPVPIIFTVDLTLGETRSPFDYYEFSLDKYHAGMLEYF